MCFSAVLRSHAHLIHLSDLESSLSFALEADAGTHMAAESPEKAHGRLKHLKLGVRTVLKYGAGAWIVQGRSMRSSCTTLPCNARFSVSKASRQCTHLALRMEVLVILLAPHDH